MRKSKRKIYPPDDRILVIAEDYDSLPDLCDGGATAALIGAGISAASAGVGAAINAGAKWGSSTYMRVAKEMANYNTQMNEATYNKYQSPAAMMRQYREAGLNPALMYNQATGNVGNISAGQVSTDANDYAGDRTRFGDAITALGGAVDAYQNVIAKNASVKNEQASTEALAQDAALTKVRADQEQIKNTFLPDQLKYQLEGQQLVNAQNAYDLELDRQFKWSERLTDLDKQRSQIRNQDIDSDKKRREMNFIDTQEDHLKQSIEESKTRQWQMGEAIKLGFGNLSVAQQNAAANAESASAASTNAYSNFTRANIEQARWSAQEPAIKANADYETFKRTGTSPGWENGNLLFKGNYLMNMFLDNIGKLTGAARDAAGARLMQSK